MEPDFRISVMGVGDVQRAVDWAAAEGWNPGAQDAACFGVVDAQGFWGGWLGDRMIAAISVVNYGSDFAFLGFYIVDPEFRGQGYGLRLWEAALKHAGNRVVGLDGVVQEQENYRKSGFELAWRNNRFGGVPQRLDPVPGVTVEPLMGPEPGLLALDAQVFPAARDAFWQGWLTAQGHVSLRAVEGAGTTGFATLRPCRTGYKIGPLVAQDRNVARALLAKLLTHVPDGQDVFLDVPEPNPEALALARELGLSPVFETARMYKGAVPQLETNLIYGVTSFELG
ncbi:MAG: GNAT family N-acetyltransferase [Rhodobacteraceae bacterium]|nr:GNAT family N-acetyltransferase [Paracoccaceae bacterium]